MTIDRRDFLTGTAAFAVSSALVAPAHAQTGGASSSADTAALAILNQQAEALLAAYPDGAAYLGLDSGKRMSLKGKLTDRSATAEAARRDDAAKRLAQLQAINRAALSPTVATHVETVIAAHEIALEGWRRMPVGDMAFLSNNNYRSTPYVVTQGNGAFVDTPDLLENKHQIANRADAEAYLSRLEAYAGQLEAETRRIQADARQNVLLPAPFNDITVAQLRAGAAQPAAEQGMIRSFADKLAKAGLTGNWTARATAIVDRRIAPALANQADALASLRPRAPQDGGMWHMPDAADRYAWLAEAATTTKRTPDEIHESGVEQCRAYAAQLDPLLRAQGLAQGTPGERLAALGKRPDLLYANTDAGRAELLEYLNTVVARLRPRLPQAFSKLVRGNLVIKRVPPAIQNGAPNGYAGPGALDGSTPGIYYINLRDTANWPRFELATLTFHEGIPGHIWQGEYTFDLPLIRTLLGFNAYSEGWGLYAEQIGAELGYYEDDPLGRIGYLQSMNFRAARLVVDTGLHHKRWSVDQAVRWLMAATGYTESRARSEINRYCIWPGQALGYKTGHNEINRLRDHAKARLAGRFDVRGFNDVVVQAGGMPLGVLAKVVDRWVAAERT
ncbi:MULTISPECIES: DUF885 domain-containing protein [unclassified Sphingomonas]|uniref:DUF885 domain-containing protein n=1 Tax=unclassified Sphingomonas TaxID=196159 RepID=UPI001D11102A|nr:MULTISPECIES: DUF885 family protein [unclassified Sphingomonas]MCC2979079.1 DUF885 family protein [Sphingomonas sp. IC4-52]MCD2315687.1 DUF885 family protein [Sphingomonas sp. IC-11]